MTKMNIYFDTEFTGLKKDTTLVSIGLVTETGSTFYAEFTDFDQSYNDAWFKKNVLNNLLLLPTVQNLNKKMKDFFSGKATDNHEKIADVEVVGTKEGVRTALEKWLDNFAYVELHSDVCHYDMVLFIDIFGTAFDLPKNVSSVCHDINADIARYYHLTEQGAFDKNREEIVKELNMKLPSGAKHNSLYDAKVIKLIHYGIMTASDELEEPLPF